MFKINKSPGRTISIDEEEFLYFSGTSYLGISLNSNFQKLVFQSIKRYGTNYGNSRISNIQMNIFDEAEHFLAIRSGAEAALVTSSGFMAGQLAFNNFAKSDHIFYAPNVHPAVCSKDYIPFDGTFLQWKEDVINKISQVNSGTILLISNAIDPLFSEPYDFNWLFDLPQNKDIVLILDDSHGYGVTGINGEGIYSSLRNLNNIDLIVTASLGKACGIPGGLILARKEVLESIKTSSMFAGSSPGAPAYLNALLHASDIYDVALKKLRQNILYFKTLIIQENNFHSLPDFPVFHTPENGLYDHLKRNKIIISSFPYPAPENKSITRIVLSSLHEENDIKRLAFLIGNYKEQ